MTADRYTKGILTVIAAALAVASGAWDEAATAEWLRTHLRRAEDGEVE